VRQCAGMAVLDKALKQKVLGALAGYLHFAARKTECMESKARRCE
jgi:hypothetical protein